MNSNFITSILIMSFVLNFATFILVITILEKG